MTAALPTALRDELLRRLTSPEREHCLIRLSSNIGISARASYSVGDEPGSEQGLRAHNEMQILATAQLAHDLGYQQRAPDAEDFVRGLEHHATLGECEALAGGRPAAVGHLPLPHSRLWRSNLDQGCPGGGRNLLDRLDNCVERRLAHGQRLPSVQRD
jgi:hypothetical protein